MDHLNQAFEPSLSYLTHLLMHLLDYAVFRKITYLSLSLFSPFETLIGKLDSENIEYFLMGDLNCDMIATRYDNNTCKLMSITDIYGLQQLITEPTRTRRYGASVHFGVVVVELINCKCGGIVRNQI